MMLNDPQSLFISFWDICLENLPFGNFSHRQLTAAKAKLIIDRARQANRLVGISNTDLLAPQHQRERSNHEKLRDVLQDHFGILLSLDDFVQHENDADKSHYSINPLCCYELRDQDRANASKSPYFRWFCRFDPCFDLENPGDAHGRLEKPSIFKAI